MIPIERAVPTSLPCAAVLVVAVCTGGCDDAPVEPEEPSQRDVLNQLHDATSWARWHNRDNWGTDAPLDTWYGVTADSDGNVIGLALGGNSLAGPIPAELGKLDRLRTLDFAHNGLEGPIPPELGSLRNLEHADLSSNGLTGSVPAELGKLGNLRTLRLYDNRLSGPIPPELGSLPSLDSLVLGWNWLFGPIPPELATHLPE